jgi:phosphate starvation-inducible PhoH-like protein
MRAKPKLSKRDLRIARAEAEAQNDPRFREHGGVALKAAATLTPKNENQRKALALLDAGTPIVLLTGSAGTGKSMLAAHRAAAQLRAKAVDKVVLMRPAVLMGDTIGLLPGDIEEKMASYFRQTLIHLRKFLGPGNYFENKKIEMLPSEYARGNSFENCVVIAEEAQNYTASEFETMFTRLGDGCQMIFTGDTKQHDLHGQSGMKATMALIERMRNTQPDYLNDEDMDHIDNDIGVVEFKPQDVVRHGLTRALVKMYYNN